MGIHRSGWPRASADGSGGDHGPHQDGGRRLLACQFGNRGPHILVGGRCSLGVMVKAGVGTVLLFCEPGGANEFVFVEGASDAPITTIYPGGNAWVVPRRYFISEASAERLLREFMDTGLRPAGDCVLLGSE